MRKKLLVLDGSSMISTAYYALLPTEIKFAKSDEERERYYHKILHAPDGTYTNAIFGMVKQMSVLIDGWRPDYVVIAFDKTRDTFRRGMYAPYKAQRSKTQEPLKKQFIKMQELLESAGFPVLISDTYEADDLAGTAAEIYKNDMSVRIVTKDRDYLQLVDDANDVRVWMQASEKELDDMGRTFELYRGSDFSQEACPWLKNYLEYTEEAVIADKGVKPKQIPDLKGIEGDTSDNYPGVKGVSSAAAPLLQEYNSIDGIYSEIDACNGDAKTEKALSNFWKEHLGIKRSPLNALKAGRDDAYLSKDLATIRTYSFTDDILAGKSYAEMDAHGFNSQLRELGIRTAELPER